MMRTEIYYFSGTGNTLAVARDIANGIKAHLIAIPNVIGEGKIHSDTDRIGIVFPSYLAPLAGLPLIVENFIRKIINIESLSIFAVCTCGGYECVNAVPSLMKAKTIIRECGGRLSAAFSVRLPMNNLDYDHIPIPITKDQDVIFSRSRIRIDRICDRIMKRQDTKFKAAKAICQMLMKPLYYMMRKSIINVLIEKANEPADTKREYFQLMPLTDRSITVSERCYGCGICARVCPANNIRLADKRPIFLHRCEMCFACDEWCPAGAIRHWSRSGGVKYHHPAVKLSDMILRDDVEDVASPLADHAFIVE